MEYRKNTGLIILIVVLSILVLGLGVYIVYDKVLSDNSDNKVNNNSNKNNSEYKLEDYVIIQKQTKEMMLSQGVQQRYTMFNFSKIEFKNIDESLVKNFYEQQNSEMAKINNDYDSAKSSYYGDSSLDDGGSTLDTTVIAQINGNILSVLVRTVKKGDIVGYLESPVKDAVYSININLDEMRLLSTEEVLDYKGYDMKKIGEKIYSSIESKEVLWCEDIPTPYEEAPTTISDEKKNSYIDLLAREVEYYSVIKDGKIAVYYWDGVPLWDKVNCSPQATGGSWISNIEL
jgi:hypothetical protein